MKDNRPLLFINSANSKNFSDKNQYVYDSRYDHDRIVIPKEEENKPVLKRKEKIEDKVEQKEIIEKPSQDNNEEMENEKEHVNLDKEEKQLSKLSNKIDLLNKRAELGRYVLVSVETMNEVIEGLFIQKDEERIIIRMDDNEEKHIDIKEISEILILRV